MILIGGEPGIGKSTLLLQAAARLEAGGPHRALRQRRGVARPDPAPGRPAGRRGRGRGARAGRDPARGHPRAPRPRSRADVVVIDSIQTVYTETLESAPGNVGQVRECSGQLMRFAKESGTAVIVVGHVTKGGGIAGPKTLEHIVDTVLYFEGEATLDYRLLRTTKNRFGSVDELGVFSMTEHGLVAVPNPSAVFLAARADGHQRQRGHRAHGRHPAGAGRGPGARGQVGLRHAAAGRHRARPQAAGGAARGAGAAGGDLVRRPRRVRAGHRRRPAERARRRSRRRRGAALEPATTGPRRPTSSSWARSAWAARSGPSGAHRAAHRRGGPARLPPGVRLVPQRGRRCRASRWSGSTTSSSWCGRLPRDVGVVVVAAGRGHPARRRDAQAVSADRRRAHGPPRAAAVRVPPRCRPGRRWSSRPTMPRDPPAFLARPRRAGARVGRRRRRARRLGRGRPRRAAPRVHAWSWCTTAPGPSSTARSSTPSSRYARAGEGAVAAVPVSDTLKEADRRRPDAHRRAPSRATRLWRAQTPQGFPRAVLERAHAARARATADRATDDAALVERDAA